MERLIFILPESLEEALYATPVLAQYMLTRMVMGRDTQNIVIVCKHEELHSFIQSCWIFAIVVKEPTEQQLEEADFVFEFDADRTYQITKAVKKHIADGFAIKLGVGLLRFLPAVLVEDIKAEQAMVLLAARNKMDGTDETWRWPYLEDFFDKLQEIGIPVIFLPEDASWNEIRTFVGKSSVVVGVRSSVTLVAAAANRLVMELSPREKAHSEWFRKTECKTYRMIYGDLPSMQPEFVWTQIEKLIQHVKGAVTAHQVEAV